MQIAELAECAFADLGKERERTTAELRYMEVSFRNTKTNISKTKVMSIGKNYSNISVNIEEKVIERINTFKYLGVHIQGWTIRYRN